MGVEHAVQPGRAQQGAGERVAAAVAHDEQLRRARLLDE
jgi:hypothetical protein